MNIKQLSLTNITLTVCFIFIFSSTSFAASKEIVSTLKHKEAGITCVDCHGKGSPKKMPHHSVCIECHDSGNGYYTGEMRTYKNDGKDRQFNVHDSHQGKVRCTVCHTVHKKPEKPMLCNACHQIDVEVK